MTVPCDICGGYNCDPCPDCEIIVHIGASPFCSHQHAAMNAKSGFEAYLDELSFPQDEYITSARQFDNLMKKHKLEVARPPDKRWI